MRSLLLYLDRAIIKVINLPTGIIFKILLSALHRYAARVNTFISTKFRPKYKDLFEDLPNRVKGRCSIKKKKAVVPLGGDALPTGAIPGSQFATSLI